MNFEDVIRKRTAVRKFSSKKISDELITKILEAGNLAPTAKNYQPQLILVAKSDKALEKIDKISSCRYQAPIVLIVCSNKDIAWNNNEFSSYEMDACIVATHMILEATNLGVDNIWIESFNRSDVKKEFQLDENIEPICLIPIGYRTSDCPMNPLHEIRKELDETVKFI